MKSHNLGSYSYMPGVNAIAPLSATRAIVVSLPWGCSSRIPHRVHRHNFGVKCVLEYVKELYYRSDGAANGTVVLANLLHAPVFSIYIDALQRETEIELCIELNKLFY